MVWHELETGHDITKTRDTPQRDNNNAHVTLPVLVIASDQHFLVQLDCWRWFDVDQNGSP